MLDVIMEGNDGEMEEFGPSLSEDLINQTFPFSVVVPAALEARNKLPKDKGKARVQEQYTYSIKMLRLEQFVLGQKKMFYLFNLFFYLSW